MRHLLKPLLALAPITTMAAQRPNIIYIMTDQQTATAMSCIGNTDLNTPNIDRLAAAGVTFTNAYCSSPLSGPSRASMFTGYMAHELGVERNGTPMDVAKAMEYLAQADFVTGHVLNVDGGFAI